MLSGHEVPKEMSFTIHCHDSNFKKVTAISDEDDNEGELLFSVKGTIFGTSWSWRRKVFSGSSNENHIFDFRHNSLDIKNGWVIETLDTGGKARTLCSLVHQAQITTQHSAVNAAVRTEAGEDVRIAIRSKNNDSSAITRTISVNNVRFAVINKEEDNNAAFRANRDRTVWKARVVPGVDLSLVSLDFIELCFAFSLPLVLICIAYITNSAIILWLWYCVALK